MKACNRCSRRLGMTCFPANFGSWRCMRCRNTAGHGDTDGAADDPGGADGAADDPGAQPVPPKPAGRRAAPSVPAPPVAAQPAAGAAATNAATEPAAASRSRHSRPKGRAECGCGCAAFFDASELVRCRGGTSAEDQPWYTGCALYVHQTCCPQHFCPDCETLYK